MPDVPRTKSMPALSILQPSVMSLLLQMRAGGQVISTGTGFVMDSPAGPVLITNWHNLSGRRPDNGASLSNSGAVPDEVVVFHNKGSVGTWTQRLEPLYRPGGAPRWIEHPKHGKAVDVVALPLTSLDEVSLFPYPADGGPDVAWGPAEPISVVGFPFGLTAGGCLAIWATGFVASEPDLNFNGLPCFLIDCRARPGQSGSAVIALRDGSAIRRRDGSVSMMSGSIWPLLGVYSGRINEQSDLGIVWKVEAIQEILTAIAST